MTNDAQDKINAFVDEVNKQYKTDLAGRGNTLAATQRDRFSSGILALDLVLGGGWPFGAISTVAGEESTGKTLIMLKTIAALSDHCKTCRCHRTGCKCGDFTPCTALFVDVEGAFDKAWAAKNGYDFDLHAHIRPDYAEQTVDVVSAALESGAFDVIVVDSLAAMTSSTEIQDSAEQARMGGNAILLNKAFRKWPSAMNRVANTGVKPPALICLNQLREKIGVMWGDSRVMPGGRGQLFASSVIVWTKAIKYLDDNEKLTAFVDLAGVTKKNKTYVPHLTYECKMALKDIDGIMAGHIFNETTMVKKGKQYGIITREGGVGFGDFRARVEDDLRAMLREDVDKARKLWAKIVKAECGVDV